MSLEGESARMIRRLGPAAVPHLIARLRRLQDGSLRRQALLWQNEYLPDYCQWLHESPSEEGRVLNIVRLLAELGPEARPAVPAIIGAAEQVHYGAYRAILDCLADLGSAADESIPWLRTMADEGGEEDFHAAWALWMVATNDTTFPRMVGRAIQVQRKPSLAQDELYLVRDDTALNRQLVPLLADLLTDPRVAADERKCTAWCLGERGLDALPALPLMRKAAAQTDLPGLRDEINDAIRKILKLLEAEATGASVLPTSPLSRDGDWIDTADTPAACFRLRQP